MYDSEVKTDPYKLMMMMMIQRANQRCLDEGKYTYKSRVRKVYYNILILNLIFFLLFKKKKGNEKVCQKFIFQQFFLFKFQKLFKHFHCKN